MKLFHLSDLHIGKRLYEYSLLEDQKYILDEIVRLAGEERPDAVLLAGDLYDKAVPPAEAVMVLDDFLKKLKGLGIPIFMISGNHDSAERVAFGAGLFEQAEVYVSPVYDGQVKHVTMQDEYGPVELYLLPFLKPSAVRHAFPEEAEKIVTFQDACACAMRHLEVDPAGRNVILSHQFVTGAELCDSEENFVGGLDSIEASLFDDFDYVALGHIHSPQSVGRPSVRYCGTPLKYSFSEERAKSVTVVELREKGDLEIRTIPLVPLRDLRKIRGTYLEVSAKSFYEGTNTQDYLMVTLTDEEDVPDGMRKLKTIYPNLMTLAYDNRRTRENQEIIEAQEIERKSEKELFEEFFEMQNNKPLQEEQGEILSKVIRTLKGQE